MSSNVCQQMKARIYLAAVMARLYTTTLLPLPIGVAASAWQAHNKYQADNRRESMAGIGEK